MTDVFAELRQFQATFGASFATAKELATSLDPDEPDAEIVTNLVIQLKLLEKDYDNVKDETGKVTSFMEAHKARFETTATIENANASTTGSGVLQSFAARSATTPTHITTNLSSTDDEVEEDKLSYLKSEDDASIVLSPVDTSLRNNHKVIGGTTFKEKDDSRTKDVGSLILDRSIVEGVGSQEAVSAETGRSVSFYCLAREARSRLERSVTYTSTCF